MPRLLLLMPVLLLLVACAPASKRPAETPTPDTGPSIAEISRQAVEAATQAALTQRTPAAAALRPTPTPTPPQQPAPSGAMLAADEMPSGFTLDTEPISIDLGAHVGGMPAGAGLIQLSTYRVSRAAGGRGILVMELLSGTDGRGTPNDMQGAIAGLARAAAGQAGANGLNIQPLTNGPAIGEEAQSMRIIGASAGSGGYLIGFRRGSIVAMLFLVESPASNSIDELALLAQKQDAKLVSNTGTGGSEAPAASTRY